ncbi:MAG: cyanophycinase, partial [Phycisphaerae bacterium]
MIHLAIVSILTLSTHSQVLPTDPLPPITYPGPLLLAGGGETVRAICEAAIRLAGGIENARMLIVPQASASPDAGESSAALWRELGVRQVEILRLDDAEAAREALCRANLIWMPGGVQSRLVDAFAAAGLIDELRLRHAQGAVIGGTSAGCAAATGVMITGDPVGPPLRSGATPTAAGLGLWNEAIVDQHFVQRGRFERLMTAVLDQPHLLGVGVDERTAIIVRDGAIEVVGEGQVVLIDA